MGGKGSERTEGSGAWPRFEPQTISLLRERFLVLLRIFQLGHNLARMAARIVVVGVVARFLLASLLATVPRVDVLLHLEVVLVVIVRHFSAAAAAAAKNRF